MPADAKKKRAPRSVPRNRARRLLRETARLLLGRGPLPWDLLLVARLEVLESTSQERRSALCEMLRKVGVLEETGCLA
jgi:ribonuclease P protein component